jgi:hypothetical protein
MLRIQVRPARMRSDHFVNRRANGLVLEVVVRTSPLPYEYLPDYRALWLTLFSIRDSGYRPSGPDG